MTSVRPNLWSQEACTNHSAARAVEHSSKILDADSPYKDLLKNITLPPENELIAGSSILAVRPDLQKKSYSAQIALEEYVHYVTQTYYFEVLGFQIVGDIACSTDSLGYFHDLTLQALDEVRHIQAYFELRRRLPASTSFAPCIPKIFQSIVASSSFNEKVIKGLVVLESLAMGLFSARLAMYRGGSTHCIDRQALKEEAQHLKHDVAIIELMMRNGSIGMAEIVDIVRQGVKELAFDILPVQIASLYAGGLDESEVARLKETGLTRAQAAVTRSSLRSSLNSFRACAKEYGRVGG